MKKTKLLTAATILTLTLIFTLTLTACDTNSSTNSNTQNNESSISDINDNSNTATTAAVEDFFPFQKDVYMKFAGIGNEYAEYETYVEFIDGNIMQIRNINPGTSAVMVYEIKDGELRLNFSKGEVYYRYDYTDMKVEDEVEVLIKEPIIKGTSWTLADGTKRSITEVDKEIVTGAGNFNALEITSEYENSIVTDYYVKDIGHVKRVFKSKDSDFTVISELEKIEKDVPYKENIRFFFPDFMNDKIAYIDREIDLFTNQDMNSIFEKEMKNIPENSELTKPITENTKVMGILIDDPLKDFNESISIDFSKELVEEMNAGSSLESMIIASITNTFGNYYQTQKVHITLGGKPYESGHFVLKSGEFFTVDTGNTYEYK